jgi:O-antigen/teichoic acid export membrane protein
MVDATPSAATTPSAPSLLRSGVLSLGTSAAPLVVALLALPLLTRHLGTERLGLLALAWAWLGYAGLLDFGLGRAVTRMVAAADAGEAVEVPLGAFVSTAHATLTVIGILVGIAGALIAPWYVTSVLHVSDGIRGDAVLSAVVFALTVPAVTGASVPRAVLEARRQFADVNFIRLPVSVGSFVVPVLLLPVTSSLTAIAAALAVIRLWAWWRYQTLSRRIMPRGQHDAPARAHLMPLMRASIWLTVSNVLSPLMTVMDRFLIGSLISVSAVALYAVPWEAVTKLWIVPGALMMVLFPAMSGAYAADSGALAALHSSGVKLVTLMVVPVCAITCVIAPFLMQLAGGTAYAGDSVFVLRLLAIGVAANCIAIVPASLLQAAGRARWMATIHLYEIVPYGLLLWLAATRWGIVGAAAAWTSRAVIDAVLMSWRAQPVAPVPLSTLGMNMAGVVIVALCAVLGAIVPATGRVQLLLTAILASLAAVVLWNQRSATEHLVLARPGNGT